MKTINEMIDEKQKEIEALERQTFDIEEQIKEIKYIAVQQCDELKNRIDKKEQQIRDIEEVICNMELDQNNYQREEN